MQDVIHYLDDFWNQSKEEGRTLLDKALATFDSLRLPVALEVPTTSLTFLGVELDTVRMVRRLPKDKLTEL